MVEYENENENKKSYQNPDSKYNYEITISVLRDLRCLNSLYYQIYDYFYDPVSHQNIINNPKYILFVWNDNKQNRMTTNVSFHQNSSNFKKELNLALNYLSKRKMIERIKESLV